MYIKFIPGSFSSFDDLEDARSQDMTFPGPSRLTYSYMYTHMHTHRHNYKIYNSLSIYGVPDTVY